jgi:ABC-type amino acid transport substrate-binding protein
LQVVHDAFPAFEMDTPEMIGLTRIKAASIAGAMVMVVALQWFCPVMAKGETAGYPDKLVVATMVMPPFLMKGAEDRWEGLSVELWQAVARELDIEYKWREYTRIESILEDVKAGKIDIVPAMAITEAHEILLDFSHQYFRSGLAIAVSKEKSAPGLLRFVKRLAANDIFVVVGVLVLLSLVAGIIVWLFEGRRNREFDGGLVQGAGHGLWWAVVTLTTVGYGDKAPQTLGGRVTALVWMFTSIVLIAGFTAAITTTLTVGELGGKIRGLEDLPGVRVGVLAQTEGMSFLAENGITARPYENVREGLQDLADKKIEAFVFNEAVLRYTVNKAFSGVVTVLPDVFDHYYVGMAMPTNSPLIEPINRALLRIIVQDKWAQTVTHYFGHHR